MTTWLKFAGIHQGLFHARPDSLSIASAIIILISLFSDVLRRLLGERGLTAMKRLMGMILTIVSMQMFLSGITKYFKL